LPTGYINGYCHVHVHGIAVYVYSFKYTGSCSDTSGCRKRQAVTYLSLAQIIESAQINNKVFGETHLFSTYPFNGASQAMISYKYMQDERSGRGET
jgi:hypothetical protein